MSYFPTTHEAMKYEWNDYYAQFVKFTKRAEEVLAEEINDDTIAELKKLSLCLSSALGNFKIIKLQIHLTDTSLQDFSNRFLYNLSCREAHQRAEVIYSELETKLFILKRREKFAHQNQVLQQLEGLGKKIETMTKGLHSIHEKLRGLDSVLPAVEKAVTRLGVIQEHVQRVGSIDKTLKEQAGVIRGVVTTEKLSKPLTSILNKVSDIESTVRRMEKASDQLSVIKRKVENIESVFQQDNAGMQLHLIRQKLDSIESKVVPSKTPAKKNEVSACYIEKISTLARMFREKVFQVNKSWTSMIFIFLTCCLILYLLTINV